MKNVDLKAAFDSVDRSALWLLLRSLGLPLKTKRNERVLYWHSQQQWCKQDQILKTKTKTTRPRPSEV